MGRLSIVFLLVVMTSHACIGVVLRPNWFPYFRRTNQTAQRLRYNPERPLETSGTVRQTRSGGAFGSDAKAISNVNSINNNNVNSPSAGSDDYPCKNGIGVLDCLVRVLNVVNRAVEREGYYASA